VTDKGHKAEEFKGEYYRRSPTHKRGLWLNGLWGMEANFDSWDCRTQKIFKVFYK